MTTASVLDEGYDALDVATNVAFAYVRTHSASIEATKASRKVTTLSPTAARTLILVDVACDLPQAWLDHHGVGVMPRVLKTSTTEVVEDRDPARAQQLIAMLDCGNFMSAQSLPLTPVATRDQMQRYMTTTPDAVLQVCVSASRSKLFVNALSATQSLVLIHNKVRRSVGKQAPLTAWVVDSLNALSGVGVTVAHAVMLRESGSPASEIAVTLNAFRRNVHTLVVLDDVSYAARAARNTERDSVSGWKAKLATWFNLKPVVHINSDRVRAVARHRGHHRAIEQTLRTTEAQLKLGLATPFVCVGYAGDLGSIESLEAYQSLKALCNRNRISLSLAVMSMTGVLSFGPRSLSVSFASQHYRP